MGAMRRHDHERELHERVRDERRNFRDRSLKVDGNCAKEEDDDLSADKHNDIDDDHDDDGLFDRQSHDWAVAWSRRTGHCHSRPQRTERFAAVMG